MCRLCLSGILFLPVYVAAHPDHEHDKTEVLYGTVIRVQVRAVELETVDHVALKLKTVSILLDEETEFLQGSTPVEALDLVRGQRVACTTRVSHALDGHCQVEAAAGRVGR